MLQKRYNFSFNRFKLDRLFFRCYAQSEMFLKFSFIVQLIIHRCVICTAMGWTELRFKSLVNSKCLAVPVTIVAFILNDGQSKHKAIKWITSERGPTQHLFTEQKLKGHIKNRISSGVDTERVFFFRMEIVKSVWRRRIFKTIYFFLIPQILSLSWGIW